MRFPKIFLIILVILPCIYCKLLPLDGNVNPYQHFTNILNRSVLECYTNSEGINIGLLTMSSYKLDAADLMSECLLQVYGIKGTIKQIFSDLPSTVNIEMRAYSDTIIILDWLNETTHNVLRPVLEYDALYKRQNRFIIILTKTVHQNLETFQENVKLLWKKSKLVNFLLVWMNESTSNVQAIGYNPFRDDFQYFTPLGNYSLADIFPNKMQNLYGYKLITPYCLVEPYIYRSPLDNRLIGLDIEFVKTFAKHINASLETRQMDGYKEVEESIDNSTGDLAAIGFFMTLKKISRTAYPHGYMDLIVIVRTAEGTSALTAILHVFDVYSWALIIMIVVITNVLKRWMGKVLAVTINMTVIQDSVLGLKILIFAFSVFNIIFSQVFQSWITTVLTAPDEAKQINSLSELVKLKWPVYIFEKWQEYVVTKEPLNYVFLEPTKLFVLPDENEASVVTSKFEQIALRNFKFWKKIFNQTDQSHLYHTVPENVGSAFLMSYSMPNSPFIGVLKHFTFNALAYGFYSKEWGGQSFFGSKASLVANNHKSLQFDHLMSVFRYFALGMLFSILVFIIEIIWFYYKNYYLMKYDYVN